MHIAFIGLGNMGGPMALNLQKAGHTVRAFDLSASACEKFAAEGLQIAPDAAAAVQGDRAGIIALQLDIHAKAVGFSERVCPGWGAVGSF